MGAGLSPPRLFPLPPSFSKTTLINHSLSHFPPFPPHLPLPTSLPASPRQVLKRVSSSRVRLGLLSVIVGWVLGYLAVAMIANHRYSWSPHLVDSKAHYLAATHLPPPPNPHPPSTIHHPPSLIPYTRRTIPYSMDDGVGGTSYQASPSALPALTLHNHSLAATHLPPSPFPHFLLTPGGPHSVVWTMGRTTQYGMDDGVGDELAGIAIRPRPPGLLTTDPMDYPKPKVFFDINIDGRPAGRIIFELFTKQAPRAAENFRALCTGEKGRVPNEPGREGAGMPLHYKGAEFYRVIDRFICQTGINTESIYGGSFKDDPLALLLKHNKKGLLSAANIGPDTTTTHFSIVVAPAPHLDGHYPIFGQVVSGWEVVERINKLAKPSGSGDERPRLPVVIADCGEIK
ncbi:unnamed protein product [Closterium sp. NIES-53]